MSSSNSGSNDRGGHHHRAQPSTSAAAQAQAQQYAHRFANAAAQAAQPLLGYLSGHAAGAEITAAAATARAANPTSSEEPSAGRRGSLDEDARRKEMRNLDSIVLQFFAKAAHVITQSRFTHVQLTGEARDDASTSRGSSSSSSKRNRWFNLELEESDIFKEELRTWKSVTSLINPLAAVSSDQMDPSSSLSRESSLGGYPQIPCMTIDVILDVSEMSGNQVLVLTDMQGKRSRVDLSGKNRPTAPAAGHMQERSSPKRCNILLERWTVSLKPPLPTSSPELPSVYKHCIILFRALYTLVRALPVFELHRKLKRRKGHPELKIGCRLSATEMRDSQGSSEKDVAEEQAMEIGLDEPLSEDSETSSAQDFSLAPIVTPVGSFHLRCRYRSGVEFSVEEIEALLSSRFIDEDFFKPTMRKYSSGQGSLQRPQFGSPASRPASRLSTSPSAPPPNPDDGAFVSYSRSRGAQVLSRIGSGTPPTSGSSDLVRRPSVGTSHPFKAPSPSLQPVNRPTPSATPPQQESYMPRLSSSPASVGPSSSLRYTYGGHNQQQPQQRPLSPVSPGLPGTSSQLSYTKRSIPSPTSMQPPPISGLSAMQITASPFSTSPRPASPLHNQAQAQPMPMTAAATAHAHQPGSSGVPMSSSPTPSLIKRYSSSRYSRSFGRESSSSSPGEHGSYWPADSASRRSRLSSTTSREGNSAAPATRQLGGTTLVNHPAAAGIAGESATPPGDADDIRSFLGLIDSRAQLPSGSVLLRGAGGGGDQGSSPSSANRLALEEKMRSMADSVFRDAPVTSQQQQQRRSPVPAAAPSGISAAMRIGQASSSPYSRRTAGSGGNSPSSFPAAATLPSRQTPSPDFQLPSPVEGSESRPAFLTSNSIRQRASQAPISTSIPEEDLPMLHQHGRGTSEAGSIGASSTGFGGHSATGTGAGGTSAGASASASGSGHFPFPRYVSSSMRRRGSGASQSSGRPSIIPSPIATAASSAIMPSVGSVNTGGGAGTIEARGSMDSMRSGGGGDESPSITQHQEDVEEQTMGQLELGSSSDVRQ